MIDKECGIPFYIQIQEIFEEMLQNSELGAGDLVPSENEFAEKIGVSRLTVRKSYNELVKRNIFYTIHGKGTFVRDDYNVVLKSTESNRKQKVIGVIIPEIDIFFREIMNGIKNYAYSNGFSVMLMFNDSEENETASIERMIQNKVCGVIIAPSRKELSVIENYQQLINSQIPVVMIGKPPFKILSDSVYSDDTFASYRCIELLLDHEHKNICYVGGLSFHDESDKERRDGYINAMKDYERESCMTLIDYQSKNFEEILRGLLHRDDPITAYFCYCDEIAYKIYRLITEMGYKIPQDIEIIGFDDSHNDNCVELTSVYQRRIEIGENAAYLLIDKIDKPHKILTDYHIIIHPKIIERNTTRN